MMDAARRALSWLAQNRRRLAPLVLVGGVALVLGPLADAAPRETSLRLRLADPGAVREVGLSVFDAGEPVLGLRLPFTRGAPPRIDESLDLPPGRYELHIDVTRGEGATRAQRTEVRMLEVPTEGVVLVELDAAGAG
jgi:hypothetical protein